MPAAAVDLAEARRRGPTRRRHRAVARPPAGPGSRRPAPATEVEVLDADGAAVGVTGRGASPPRRSGSSSPAGRVPIAAWAGPWPAEERWWDPARARRRARLQVVDAAGTARLLCREDGRWWLEAVYD